MMKADNTLFRINNIGEHTYISFDISTNELDDVAYGSLKYNTPYLMMPIQFEEEETFVTLRYGVPSGYIKLDELVRPLKIEEVLMIYSGIIEGLENCEDWYLETEGFYFNENCIYITEDKKKMGLMYCPQKGYKWELMTLKEVLIALLEKCDESHGGSIQLQLYKYFYKPQFVLSDFKTMLRKFKEQTIERPVEKLKVVPKQPREVKEVPLKVAKEIKAAPSKMAEPVKKTLEASKTASVYDAKVKKEEAVMQPNEIIAQIMKTEAITPENKPVETKQIVKPENKGKVENIGIQEEEAEQPSYHPTYNRSQLSQEEIEAMVKSIYGAKTEQVNKDDVSSKPMASRPATNEKSIYERPTIEKQSEKKVTHGLAFEEEKEQHSTSFTGKKESKRRGLFENVFANQKQAKSAPATAAHIQTGTMLKAISSHPRYDLPKTIPLSFKKGAFVIGRASRNGEQQGVDFEFGGEITPISHVHAQIEKKDGIFYLKDLGSSNGTFLNGEKIEANKPYMIEEGDKIAFAIAFSSNSIEYTFIE